MTRTSKSLETFRNESRSCKTAALTRIRVFVNGGPHQQLQGRLLILQADWMSFSARPRPYSLAVLVIKYSPVHVKVGPKTLTVISN